MRSAPAPSAECAPPLACVHRRPAAAASPAGTLRPPRRTEELRSPPARRPRARLRGSIDPANRGKDGVAVAQVAGQKTAALRDVYPCQQRRIAGGIRRAVAADAGHPQMDGFDFGDQPLRLGGRAEVVTDTNWLVRRRRPIISSRKLSDPTPRPAPAGAASAAARR